VTTKSAATTISQMRNPFFRFETGAGAGESILKPNTVAALKFQAQLRSGVVEIVPAL
jgi:hypothetical protein